MLWGRCYTTRVSSSTYRYPSRHKRLLARLYLSGWGDPDPKGEEGEDEAPEPVETIPLPDHLAHHQKRISKVDVEVSNILSFSLSLKVELTSLPFPSTRLDFVSSFLQTLFLDAPVDTSLYNLYLHQNYPLFCGDIDECFDSIEALSGSDAMKTEEDLVRRPASLSFPFLVFFR